MHMYVKYIYTHTHIHIHDTIIYGCTVCTEIVWKRCLHWNGWMFDSALQVGLRPLRPLTLELLQYDMYINMCCT